MMTSLRYYGIVVVNLRLALLVFTFFCLELYCKGSAATSVAEFHP